MEVYSIFLHPNGTITGSIGYDAGLYEYDAGLGQLGDTRPSPYYVRRGDIVRVYLGIKYANTAYTASNATALRTRLQLAGLQPITVDDSNVRLFTGGDLIVEVQPSSSDFNNVQDVANLVAGAATAAGYSVRYDGSSPRGQIVSYADSSGGYATPTGGGIPDPRRRRRDDDSWVSGGTLIAVTLAGVLVIPLLIKRI